MVDQRAPHQPARVMVRYTSPAEKNVLLGGSPLRPSGHLTLSASELLAGKASNAWPLRYAAFLY